jgi:hypothetical protein
MFYTNVILQLDYFYLFQLVELGYVAQLDRATDSGSVGQGFKSLRTRYLKVPPTLPRSC